MTNASVYLGIDIGGTKVAARLVNETGEILSQVRVPMNSSGDAAAGLTAVMAAINKVLSTESAVIKAIGVSSPGPLDSLSGVVINPPNLPCWHNFPLQAEIERACGSW